MLARLISIFAGKSVRITHTNKKLGTEEGICKTVHAVPGEKDQFNIELKNGNRYGFVPEIVTSSSVDGELRAFAGGRRKVELI